MDKTPEQHDGEANNTVMLSIFLRPGQDAQLRQLAHHYGVTKSDLIRAALDHKLRDWLDMDVPHVLAELRIRRF